ncbi:MAG TPA: helix-turn-helix domain-containing protein [Solirubrobacteraceae bacterium]|nr:helix-turn-helix domain-containing protein [Solirubrobacteraceae bacterium]
MKRTSLHDYPCSIARALDAAGEWWTPLIVRDIAYGVRRFGEIQEDLGISANVLSDRLDTLLAEGLAQTRVYQRHPVRHEYILTEKGLDLLPALLALMSWGDRWAWQPAGGPVRVLHEHCGHEVSVELRCAHCDAAVAPSELRAKLSGRLTQPPRERAPGHLSAKRLMDSSAGVELGG